MNLDFLTLDLRWMHKKFLEDKNPYFYHRVQTYEDYGYIVKLADKLKTENLNLVIDNCTEGSTSALEGLYNEFLTKTNFPANRVYFLSCAVNINDDIEQFSTKYNVDKITGVYVNYFAYLTGYRYFNDSTIKEKFDNLLDKVDTFDKTYLNLNRRWDIHRFTLVALLSYYDLLSKGYVSLSSKHPVDVILSNKNKFNKNLFKVMANTSFTDINDNSNMQKIWSASIPYIKNTFKNNSTIQEIFSDENRILQIPELTLTLAQLFASKKATNSFDSYGWKDDLDYYHVNSLINLVTETSYFSKYDSVYDSSYYFNLKHDSSIVFTEKVYRPMLYRQPFILVTVPYALQGLRSLGFKTYSPFINESYDTETDDGNRLLMIVGEIKRLCSLSPAEINDFTRNTSEIAEHNYKLLVKIYGEFLSSL